MNDNFNRKDDLGPGWVQGPSNDLGIKRPRPTNQHATRTVPVTRIVPHGIRQDVYTLENSGPSTLVLRKNGEVLDWYEVDLSSNDVVRLEVSSDRHVVHVNEQEVTPQ
jgi:hypothetical protein